MLSLSLFEDRLSTAPKGIKCCCLCTHGGLLVRSASRVPYFHGTLLHRPHHVATRDGLCSTLLLFRCTKNPTCASEWQVGIPQAVTPVHIWPLASAPRSCP